MVNRTGPSFSDYTSDSSYTSEFALSPEEIAKELAMLAGKIGEEKNQHKDISASLENISVKLFQDSKEVVQETAQRIKVKALEGFQASIASSETKKASSETKKASSEIKTASSEENIASSEVNHIVFDRKLLGERPIPFKRDVKYDEDGNIVAEEDPNPSLNSLWMNRSGTGYTAIPKGMSPEEIEKLKNAKKITLIDKHGNSTTYNVPLQLAEATPEQRQAILNSYLLDLDNQQAIEAKKRKELEAQTNQQRILKHSERRASERLRDAEIAYQEKRRIEEAKRAEQKREFADEFETQTQSKRKDREEQKTYMDILDAEIANRSQAKAKKAQEQTEGKKGSQATDIIKGKNKPSAQP